MIVMQSKFCNVLLLGFSFTFIFTAFQTMSVIEQTLLQSIAADSPGFTGSGYVSLAIIYGVFSVSNWLAPSFVALIGAKWTMVLGAVTYLHFIASFLRPSAVWLYASSAINGLGGALLWTAQGHYLTVMSSPATVARNSAIFWTQFQLSLLLGSIFVYTQFSGTDRVPAHTRHLVVTVLTIVCAIGVLLFAFLRPCPHRGVRMPSASSSVDCEDDSMESTLYTPPAQSMLVVAVSALKEAFALLRSSDMLLLSVTFFYTGLELSFFSGIYSTCIGNTNTLDDQKRLVGLSGLMIGLGELCAGGILTMLSIRRGSSSPPQSRSAAADSSVVSVSDQSGHYRSSVVLGGGLVAHCGAYLLAFLALPSDSVAGTTSHQPYVSVGGREMALACSCLLGVGDACFNTQLYSLLGSLYAHSPTAAFAIFKFLQALAAAVSFAYSTALFLHWQLLLLVAAAVGGATTFCLVELRHTRPHATTRHHYTESSPVAATTAEYDANNRLAE